MVIMENVLAHGNKANRTVLNRATAIEGAFLRQTIFAPAHENAAAHFKFSICIPFRPDDSVIMPKQGGAPSHAPAP